MGRVGKIIKHLSEILGKDEIASVETVQELWSGYGEIARVYIDAYGSVIVKFIEWPNTVIHPRGWVSDMSHNRKVTSYSVEEKFYQGYASETKSCQVPQYLGSRVTDNGIVLVLEDLNSRGFSSRLSSVNENELKACIRWLAQFHATFLGRTPKGLWKMGTYWHLDTRPDEFDALPDGELKAAASKLDQALKDTPQTLVHGDAKLANFCFSDAGDKVAAVDFQYVGAGCGMKDLAYFVGSCISEDDCESNEKWILDFYFSELRYELTNTRSVDEIDAIELSWRPLYPVAWADFHRFLKGWSPGHWKINGYSERMCLKAMEIFS